MMLGPQPRAVLGMLGRPFTFRRGAQELAVQGFLRGLRAGELVNSDVQADAFVVLDIEPFETAGIAYLLKFDRLISQGGESYTVQASRVAYDGERPVFHKAYVRGGT